MSDRRYDKLIRQSKRLNADNMPRGEATVAKESIEHDFQHTHFDLEYVKIIDELEALESRVLCKRLEKWLVDVSVRLAMRIIAAAQRVQRSIRKYRSPKKPQSKKPAPPGDDESLGSLARSGGFSYIF